MELGCWSDCKCETLTGWHRCLFNACIKSPYQENPKFKVQHLTGAKLSNFTSAIRWRVTFGFKAACGNLGLSMNLAKRTTLFNHAEQPVPMCNGRKLLPTGPHVSPHHSYSPYPTYSQIKAAITKAPLNNVFTFSEQGWIQPSFWLYVVVCFVLLLLYCYSL